MATIAREANVAVGSLYYYFDSKEALLSGLYADVAKSIAEAVSVQFEPDTDHATRIRRYISDYLAFALTHPRRTRIVDFLGDDEGFGNEEFGREFHVIVSMKGIALFSEAQAAGVLREGDPYMLSTFVRGAIRHFVKRRLSDNKPPIRPEEAGAVVDMCWRAIAA